MTNLNTSIENNPRFFVLEYKEDKQVISIDYARILSFNYTNNGDEKNPDYLLSVLFSTDNARYRIYSKSELERFINGYNDYTDSVKVNADDITIAAKSILKELSEELIKENEKVLLESFTSLKTGINDIVVEFKNEVKEQADLIIHTALKHQKDINEENEQYLGMNKELSKNAQAFMDSLSNFEDRVTKLTTVFEGLVPLSDDDIKILELNNNSVKEEIKNV